MGLSSRASIKAVIFDYGNTLIEFGASQVNQLNRAVGTCLREVLGPFDEPRLLALQETARMAPYSNGYRETDFRELSVALVRELYGRDPTTGEIDELLAVRLGAFVDSIHVEPGVVELLERLSSRFSLGLLSNYPSGEAIRRSLEKTGIARHLSSVVVSGDLGYVKPHPLTFETILDELGARPDEALHVGDNWLADVQGAKRLGIGSVHVRRWLPFERFDPDPSEHAPDVIIHDIGELAELLCC